jgi:hypothetical protein
MTVVVEGKAKVGGLVRPLGPRNRRRKGPPAFVEREDVDRVGPFDGHDQRIAVGREPDLGRRPWERWRVQAAPKLIRREGPNAGVAVQEAAGAGAWIDGRVESASGLSRSSPPISNPVMLGSVPQKGLRPGPPALST